MTAQTQPYEILLRFREGVISGAHYVSITSYRDDAGLLITETQSPAQPLPPGLTAEVLGEITAAALARTAAVEAELAAALTALETATTQKDEAVASHAAAMQQITDLTLQLEPYLNPPPSLLIENWRAKAVLSLAGLLPAVEAALAAMPEPERTVALYAWNGGAPLDRHGSTVLAIATALALTDAQVDAMFAQAASFEV